MQFLRFGLSLFAILAFVSSTHAAPITDFLDYSRAGLPGRLYVPPEAANPSEPRPLILFLHGAGETGSNNTAQVNGNIDNLLANAKSRGAFLYAPQATTFTWGDTTRTSDVMAMIDEAIVDFNIDPERLYVTGLSMGGGGVWNMLSRFEDRFAAAVPICAVSPASPFSAANLVGKPAWAFHARDDGTVSAQTSRSVVNQVLSAAGGGPLTFPALNEPLSTVRYTNDAVGINYTELSNGGHGIWGSVYNTPEVYDWMYSQILRPPFPVPPMGSGQVIINNSTPQYLIGDQLGNAIPARTGFAAVGTIDLADEIVAATSAGSLAQLASSFTQFGASIPVGVRGVERSIYGNLGAPLAESDPLIGRKIYVVVGDGADIASSDSLFVLKSNEQFAPGSPTFMANIAIGASLDPAQILLGTHGTVFSSRLGFRSGIVAAAVNIPEPATSMLLAVGVATLFRSRRRPAHQI